MKVAQPILQLDIDGVTVDGDQAHKDAVYELCRRRGVEISDEQYDATLSLSMEKQWAILPEKIRNTISRDDYIKYVPIIIEEITDGIDFPVLPGVAQLVETCYLEGVLIGLPTSGERRLPRKKVQSLINAVAQLPRGTCIPPDKLPIFPHQILKTFASPKPFSDAYEWSARATIRQYGGFKKCGYQPHDFMKYVVAIEDANKNIPGILGAGASAIQVRFMKNSPQLGALFVETLADPRVLDLIMSKRTVLQNPAYSATRRANAIIPP